MDGSGKRSDKDEYPIIAVREAILNALIHRDYSMLTENTPITIEMYRDCMEVVSKGGLYGGGSVKKAVVQLCLMSERRGVQTFPITVSLAY